MSKNELATANKTNEMSAQGAQGLVTEIKNGLALVSQGYLAITPHVAKLYDCKGFKALGYKNFDELCAMEFGMSHGTTVGIRKVFDKFGTVSAKNEYSIPAKYIDFGYTKLLTFANDWDKFKAVGIDPVNDFEPSMTIKEMRSKLANAIEEHDNKAIETQATEPTETQATERTPFDVLDSVISDIKELKELSELNNWIKPDKLALFDAIIANAKDIKKLLKKS